LRHLITLFLFFILAIYPHQGSAASSKTTRSAGGTLQVWVPAGLMGDNYWIYLNGHLVSAPPHNAPTSADDLIMVKVGSGWELWNHQGLMLKSIGDDGWDRDHSPYTLDAATRDALRLFQPVEIPLRAGSYRIDLVVLPQGPVYNSSFPFVTSVGWQVEVRKGKTSQLFLSIPSNFTRTGGAPRLHPMYRVCPGAPAPPDLVQLQGLIKEYLDDPMVKILRSASVVPHHKGIVVLDLPSEQGGSREFDGKQIRHIADTIAVHHDFPSQDDVNDCLRRFPQFSRSYGQYGKLLSVIDQDLAYFRKLADELEGNR
jgi:hypothetical protein